VRALVAMFTAVTIRVSFVCRHLSSDLESASVFRFGAEYGVKMTCRVYVFIAKCVGSLRRAQA